MPKIRRSIRVCATGFFLLLILIAILFRFFLHEKEKDAEFLDEIKLRVAAFEKEAAIDNGWPLVKEYLENPDKGGTVKHPETVLLIKNGSDLYQKLYFHSGKERVTPSNEEISSFVREFNPFYEKLKVALSKKHFSSSSTWPSRSQLGGPNFLLLRSLAFALNLKGDYHFRRQEYRESLETVILGEKLGRQIESGGCFINGMVGVAIRHIAQEQLMRMVYKLNVGMNAMRSPVFLGGDEFLYQDVVKILEDLPETAQAFPDRMDCEYILGLTIFNNLRDDDSIWAATESNLSLTDDTERITFLFKRRLAGKIKNLNSHLILWEKRVYHDWYYQMRPYFRLSCAEYCKEGQKKNEELCTDLSKHFLPIAAVMIPNISMVFCNAHFVESRGNALKLLFVLYAYRQEKHEYPETLETLVPLYLKQLPPDPFASDGKFRYERRSGAFLLYSVGPDGHDGGGSRALSIQEFHKHLGDAKGDLLFPFSVDEQAAPLP